MLSLSGAHSAEPNRAGSGSDSGSVQGEELHRGSGSENRQTGEGRGCL